MIWSQSWTHEWEEDILTICACSTCWDLHKGFRLGYLGACAPCTATLAVLIRSFVVSCVFGVCKAPRPNLRVYVGLSVCPGFSLRFLWYCFSVYRQISFVIFKFFIDVRWRKGMKGENPCLFLSKTGPVLGRKSFHLVPKSTQSYK